MSFSSGIWMIYNKYMSQSLYFAIPVVPDFAEHLVPAVKRYYDGEPQVLIDYVIGLNIDALDKANVESLVSGYEDGGRELFPALMYKAVKQEEESLGVDFFERMEEALPSNIFKIVNKLSEDEGELVEFETDEPISYFGYITKAEVESIYNFMRDQTFANHLLPYTNFMQETLKKALDKKVELITVHSWL